MTYTCAICGNSDGNNVYTAREMKLGLRETFTYFRCAACGCLQIAEIPGNIEKYYSGYYAFETRKETENFLIRYLRRQLFGYRLTRHNLIGKLLSVFQEEAFSWAEPGMFGFNSSVLDVGCGTGRLLIKMANSGFTNLKGIDPFLEQDLHYTVHNIPIPIEKASVYEVQGKFDLIMLHHVLEHMPDQHKVFEQLASLMHERSKLLINIPVMDTSIWERYGMNGFQLADVPRHYFLHTLESIRYLAEQHSMKIDLTGFYVDPYIFTYSEKLSRDISLYDPLEFTKQESRFFRKELKRLKKSNSGGLAYFYMSLK